MATGPDTAALRQVIQDQLKLSRRLKDRVAELEARTHAPVAVVGTAMRLPGGIDTPEAYRTFLYAPDPDTRALGPIPEDRTGLRSVYHPERGKEGHSYVDRAGFLDDIASFDAAFFGISQREAETMDPQQRMLLEVAWEALERGGIAARRQDRLPIGVFVGVMASEYGRRFVHDGDYSRIDPYHSTGSGHCFVAGRISYALGLSGPATSVDTACSSSLVAIHQAVRALRGGECDYALAGGANLILGPDLMVSLCQGEALSPGGRSRSFLADADGYGRGEGVGMVALMRLDDALAQGHPVLAVVRGSAVNHDGASSGFTVPSGPAQQEVIRAALADARVAPGSVGYVEAHGTGTALGDPIEVGALDAVLGTGAGERPAPVALGSVKARIGHLEAAAGIAGVLKLVLMLGDGTVPAGAQPGDGRLNPLIPWDRIALTVPREAGPWAGAPEERTAGISAFGLSGTNAHAVLSSYPQAPTAPADVPADHPELLTLSAKDPRALTELSERVQEALTGLDAAGVASLSHTLRAGRVHFGHRLAVVGTDAAALADALAAGQPADGVRSADRVVLETGADTAVLDGALTELARHFPGLGEAIGAEGTPAARLRAVLTLLGVKTTLAGGDTAAPGARITAGGQSLPLAGDAPEDAPRLLTEALAALYRGGAPLRLDRLGAPGAVFTDAPTYPFQRKRFWIEETAPEPAHPVAVTVTPTRTAPLDRAEIGAYLTTELAAVLKADCGLDPDVPFSDVGGDSFTAMLLTKSVEQKYGVDLPTLDCPVEMPVAELLAHLSDQVCDAMGVHK
ncbi:beta-ketoacyl synthase [Streptomyces gardneri]|uniref:type I polyketide synthase n=1 Tax=Streptomyces gardneri TaxID=66892 RepID=UPI0006E2E808|nr:type I polyketide synthase [Streptomyces gardneri]QPK45215.1 beta-ketoacyl synthase [Streptomyces gardneri]WRK36531.1 beta-ketoacyl synthase N-terminal-like domain-containing protein [Streptomyces venezuelae]